MLGLIFKILAAVATALLTLAPSLAFACRGNSQVPAHGKASGYEVLAVEVTGVRLTSYEWYRAAQLKLQPWPKAPNGEDLVYITSSTPQFQVQVLLHGSTASPGDAIREFSLGGCGVRVPALKEPGLLFVAPGRSVGVVWADRAEEYGRWLQELGLGSRHEP